MRVLVFVAIVAILSMFLIFQAEAARVSLQWNAPTTNEDGTPLTDLAGFIVYWGFNPGEEAGSETLRNVTTTQLESTTWDGRTVYFRVTAYDDKSPANESLPSNEISIPFPPAPDVTAPSRPTRLRGQSL